MTCEDTSSQHRHSIIKHFRTRIVPLIRGIDQKEITPFSFLWVITQNHFFFLSTKNKNKIKTNFDPIENWTNQQSKTIELNPNPTTQTSVIWSLHKKSEG